MARTFRLALAQINPTVGDIPGNTSRILDYVERARQAQADLVAFPELAIPGYPPEDLLFKPSFLQDNMAAMQQVVAASRDIAVVVGYVHLGADISNAAAWATTASSSTPTTRCTCPITGCSTRTATSAVAIPVQYTPSTA